MARSDDYQTNDTGHLSPYDIILNDEIGLSFHGDTPVKGHFGPGEIGQKNTPGEYPIIFNDYSNGMGMAYSGVPNTYAFAINGYTRTQRKFMPGGLLTEIDLSGLGFDLNCEIRAAINWDASGNNQAAYVGIGHHIVKVDGNDLDLITGLPNLTDEYDVGEECQIDEALVYNNFPFFTTDSTFDQWQYLTGWNGAKWTTANANGTAIGNGFQLNVGADDYTLYSAPVYLEKLGKYFQEVDGTGGNRIVGNDTPFTFIQTQSLSFDTIVGDQTAYSSSIQVGDSTYAITGIFEDNRMFVVTKGDGTYGIETSGVYTPLYTPGWRENPSLFNGISGIMFDGKFFVGTYQGVEMIDLKNRQRIDIPKLVSPSYFLSNETPIFGIPTAMTTDNGWAVTSLWNSIDSHLCYFRPTEDTSAEKSPAPVIWHGSECTIRNERITMLLKTNLMGRPMMLIGTYFDDSASDTPVPVCKMYWLSLPKEGDPYMDYFHGEGHEFTTECRLYLPFQDADDPNAKKFVRRYDTQADGLTFPILDSGTGDVLEDIAAGELDFYANADSGSRIFFETVGPSEPASEWQYQGIVSTSPKATMIPTTSATSGSQIGVLIVGRLLNQSDDLTPVYSPFAVRSIKVRADLSIEQLEMKTYTVSLGHLGSTRKGRDHGDMNSKFALLAALQDDDAVYIIDEHGDRALVKVEPGMEYYLKREDHRSPYTYIIEFSVTYIGRQFIYDVGHTFDSVYAWGA